MSWIFNPTRVTAQNSQDDNHLPCHLFFLGGPVGFPSRIFAVFWCRTIRSRKPTCELSWKKFRQKMQHWHRRFKLVERALLRPNDAFHQQLKSGRWGESTEDIKNIFKAWQRLLFDIKYDRTVLKLQRITLLLFIFPLQASVAEFERLAASLSPADVFDVWLSEGDQQAKTVHSHLVILFVQK